MLLTWVEMRRRPGRFALLGGAVALLVLLLLFFQAVAGALTSSLTGGLERQDGDVVVLAERARRSPLASVLDPAVVDDVRDVPGVARAAGVTWTPLAIDGEDAVLVGIEPDGPGVPGPVVEGRLPEAEGEAAVASSSIGGAVAAGVGGEVALAGIDGGLEVVGIVDGATVNAAGTYFVTAEAAKAAIAGRVGVDVPPTISFVTVAVDAADGDANEVAARITNDVDGVEALDRATAVASLPGIGTISRSFGILYILLYLVVAIVTAVFFLIFTVQKRDALLLLRAVGARRRDLVLPTLVQVLVVVGVAAVLGAAVAAGLLAAARDVFGSGLDVATVVTTILAMLALGLVAGALSIRRILTIDPLEAVRAGGLE